MATLTRSNPKAFETLVASLKGMDGVQAKAGWFESSVYEDGTPVAYIAAIQEMGATINHPGGTPYMIGKDGRAIFVSKSSAHAGNLPVTKPHQIVIPPRPFMRPTAAREGTNWMNLLGSGSKAVLAGKMSPHDVLEAVSARAAGDIAKTISQITSPPLKASTIANRRRSLTNRTIVGALDKPLVAQGIMINSVTNVVEKT